MYSSFGHFAKFGAKQNFNNIGRGSFSSPKVRKRESKVVYKTGNTGVMRSPRGILKSLGLAKPAQNTTQSKTTGFNKFNAVSEVDEVETVCNHYLSYNI